MWTNLKTADWAKSIQATELQGEVCQLVYKNINKNYYIQLVQKTTTVSVKQTSEKVLRINRYRHKQKVAWENGCGKWPINIRSNWHNTRSHSNIAAKFRTFTGLLSTINTRKSWPLYSLYYHLRPSCLFLTAHVICHDAICVTGLKWTLLTVYFLHSIHYLTYTVINTMLFTHEARTRKLVSGLFSGVVWVILSLSILVQYRLC